MHIALLRAVNVGGRGTVSMAALETLMADLGLQDGRTLLQSGNLVFRADGRGSDELERLLESEIERGLGLSTTVFVRSGEDWRAIVEANPFPETAREDPGHLLVHALKAAPSEGSLEALRARITGPERVHAGAREVYIAYPEGVGRSRLTPALLDTRLGRGTGRNWNTVLKLAALVA